MSKLLLSFACAVLLIVNVVSINSKNSLSRKEKWWGGRGR